MKFKVKLQVINYVIRSRFRMAHYPLAIRWNITNKCVFNCVYCNTGSAFLAQQGKGELKTKEVLLILKQISHCGVIRISFIGGEPMMREDIEKIITHCADTGIGAEMNSTGKYIPARVKELRKISLLKLSLDGSKELHESVKRGVRFEDVTKAADACIRQDIKFTFCATITKHNVRHLDSILDIARFYNTIVAFQPVHPLFEAPNAINNYYPSPIELRAAVEMLIRKKREGSRHIRNSLLGLRYLYNWPDYPKLRCWAGKVFCMINPDGTLMPCDRITYNLKLPNCIDGGFIKAFRGLPLIKKCSGCAFCGTLELNFLMSYKHRGVDLIRR